MTLQDTLRQALRKNCHATETIANETEVDPRTIDAFRDEDAEMSLTEANGLAEYLGLTLVCEVPLFQHCKELWEDDFEWAFAEDEKFFKRREWEVFEQETWKAKGNKFVADREHLWRAEVNRLWNQYATESWPKYAAANSLDCLDHAAYEEWESSERKAFEAVSYEDWIRSIRRRWSSTAYARWSRAYEMARPRREPFQKFLDEQRERLAKLEWVRIVDSQQYNPGLRSDVWWVSLF